jgi:hypothetical protein
MSLSANRIHFAGTDGAAYRYDEGALHWDKPKPANSLPPRESLSVQFGIISFALHYVRGKAPPKREIYFKECHLVDTASRKVRQLHSDQLKSKRHQQNIECGPNPFQLGWIVWLWILICHALIICRGI